MVSKSSNKIHQTWGPLFARPVSHALTINVAGPGRRGASVAGRGPGAVEVEEADVVGVLEGEVERLRDVQFHTT